MSFSFVSQTSSKPKPTPPKLSRRSSGSSRRRASKLTSKCRAERKKESSSKEVAERMVALRKLIPSVGNEVAVTAEQLFDEAAEYILLLRSRVEVLKHLVDCYTPGERNAALS